MATSRLPRRIAELIGGTLAEVTESSLQNLVGVRESDDLECKSRINATGDSAKRELCADVAAFANGRGGLLLIGASEVNDEIAELVPTVSDGEALRIQQVLASGVAPPLDVNVAYVASGIPDFGYLLIDIPASARAPHAVVHGQNLRYPIRDGPRKRWMNEPEVADRYLARYTRATLSEERLGWVHNAAKSPLSEEDEHAWLVIAMVPDEAGRLPIDVAGTRSTAEFLETDVAPQLPMGASRLTSAVQSRLSTGYRCYIAADSQYTTIGAPKDIMVMLHSDGSTGLALAVGFNWDRGSDSPVVALTVGDSRLAFDICSALVVAAAHAERSGASGEVAIAASLFVRRRSIRLGRYRDFGMRERLPNTRDIGSTEVSRHTFAADDLTPCSSKLTSATYIVAGDLMSNFGQPECLQLNSSGEIRSRYIELDLMPAISAWAARWGIRVTDEQVGA